MPQITVTLSDDTFWDLQNLPKGLKSKFVNSAVHHLLSKLVRNGEDEPCPRLMHKAARGFLGDAFQELREEEE